MATGVRTAIRWLGWVAALAAVCAACARTSADGRTIADNSTASPSVTPPPRATTAPSTPPATTSASRTTAAPTTHASPSDTTPAATRVTPLASISELIERQEELIDESIHVEARVFFLEECPPPDVAGGPCELLLFVADLEQDVLLYGERQQAVPGTVGGDRVTCTVGPASRLACPGWENAAAYEIVGTVRRAEFGRGAELDITERARA